MDFKENAQQQSGVSDKLMYSTLNTLRSFIESTSSNKKKTEKVHFLHPWKFINK